MSAQTQKVDVLAATHRYPAEVRWGKDYADGWRYIIATDDDDAHRKALGRGARITRENMQRRVAFGWEFVA